VCAVIALCNGTSGYDLAKDLLRKKNDAFDGVAIDVKLAVGNAQDFINYAKTTNFPIHGTYNLIIHFPLMSGN
jgi:hypothetical protein